MKSKIIGLSMAAAFSVALALGMVGCSQSYHSSANAPQMSIHSEHSSVQVGESVWIHATTMNLTNSNIKWKVSPTTATLKPDDSRGDQYAKFSATQPGGYMIKAYAKTGDGQWVTSRTSIKVVGTSN
jgi:predicted DNA-binding protein (MmcQ/YjbR family)